MSMMLRFVTRHEVTKILSTELYDKKMILYFKQIWKIFAVKRF